ncbi:MAG: RDD family protein, partial [Rickettsiales bacterium]|nr:RDD family protein [Rickettsiales bacterium]
HFGTFAPKSTQSHVQYILEHPFVTHSLILLSIVIFVGVIYYTYFNSSKWQATPGKRMMSLRIVKNENEDIGFNLALSHYLLSITPYVYVLYLAFYKIHNEITFFEAITSSRTNLILGIFFVMWLQFHIFTKKKTTFYDMVCKTSWIKQKTNSKYPW